MNTVKIEIDGEVYEIGADSDLVSDCRGDDNADNQ